jgi:hypothetical protein
MSEREANLPLAQSDQFNAVGQPNPGYNPAATGMRGTINNRFVGVFSNPNFSTISSDQDESHSTYNSLQAQLNRQFSSALSGQVAYTWSKCLDNGSASSGLEQGSYEWTDPWDGGYDRGPCTFNANQVFRINAIYALPFKQNRLVSGWQVAPIFSASSGLPINVQTGFASGGMLGYTNGIEGDRPSFANNNPNCKQVQGSVQQWWNPECYILPPYGTLGNVPRNSIVGPGFMDLDFSLIKNTKLTERLGMQFRAEFFNILNHPDFANPPSGTGVFSGGAAATAASVTGSSSDYLPGGANCSPTTPGVGAVCYSYIPGVASGGARLSSTTTNSRQIQFALKFLF